MQVKPTLGNVAKDYVITQNADSMFKSRFNDTKTCRITQSNYFEIKNINLLPKCELNIKLTFCQCNN